MPCEVTYDELAAFSTGDLSQARADDIRRHVEQCPACMRRLDALRKTDRALGALPPMEPSATAILRARRALSETQHPQSEPEVMTLEDVARFLRLSLDELSDLVEELPAFELGGQIRVRRARLVEWIEQRERRYGRGTAHSRIARVVRGTVVKGVA